MTIESSFLSKWFSGKALVNATEALALLNESIALGYWAPKASVKVPAALSKANVAEKTIGVPMEKLTKADPEVAYYHHPLHDLARCFSYGLSFARLAGIDFSALPTNDLVVKAQEVAADFAPVAAAIAKLEKESEANKKVAKQGDSKNPMGVCACCFNAQKVKPDGTMFQHGYERPGYGYIIGGCPGSMFKPYSM